MALTIVAPPTFEDPDQNGLTRVRLRLSSHPTATWSTAFIQAGESTVATERPSQFDVEDDEIWFSFNASATPPAGKDHELLRYLDAVRRWRDSANRVSPKG